MRREQICAFTTLDKTYRQYALDKLRDEGSRGTNRKGEYSNDVDKYNEQIEHIQENALWFAQYEKELKILSVEQASEIYKNYRIKKQSHSAVDLIFFSDFFLIKAIEVMAKKVEDQIQKIKKKNDFIHESVLTSTYEALYFYRELVEELRKLADFSVRFGYMKDQNFFETSFYFPKVEGKKCEYILSELNGNIPSNCIFIASTYFPPSYPNYYYRLYEKFSDIRRDLSMELYQLVPNFLNRKASEEVENSIKKERVNTIQMLAIFSALIAFVTTSAGAFLSENSVYSFGKFCAIFIGSMIGFLALIRLVVITDGSKMIRLLRNFMFQLIQFVIILGSIIGVFIIKDNLIQFVFAGILFLFSCLFCINRLKDKKSKDSHSQVIQEDI